MKDRKTKIWECLFFLVSLLFLAPFLLVVHQIWKVSCYYIIVLVKDKVRNYVETNFYLLLMEKSRY